MTTVPGRHGRPHSRRGRKPAIPEPGGTSASLPALWVECWGSGDGPSLGRCPGSPSLRRLDPGRLGCRRSLRSGLQLFTILHKSSCYPGLYHGARRAGHRCLSLAERRHPDPGPAASAPNNTNRRMDVMARCLGGNREGARARRRGRSGRPDAVGQDRRDGGDGARQRPVSISASTPVRATASFQPSARSSPPSARSTTMTMTTMTEAATSPMRTRTTDPRSLASTTKLKLRGAADGALAFCRGASVAQSAPGPRNSAGRKPGRSRWAPDRAAGRKPTLGRAARRAPACLSSAASRGTA